MSEPLQVTDLWRRSLDATVKFYSALGELAVEYAESLLATATDSITSINSVETKPGPAAANGSSTPTPVSKSPAVATMVLEAPAGKKALGVFLVENVLAQAVSATATAGALLDDDGNQIKASLEFQPQSVTLQPGEQALVRVSADISEEVTPGVRYHGEIGVPGLPGTRIPIVIGRTAETQTRRATKAGGPSQARARKQVANRKSSGRRTRG